MGRRYSWTYGKAGIDLNKIKRVHDRIDQGISSTLLLRKGKLGEVYQGSGHYAGLVRIGNKRLLALHTDGVGTKVLVAQEMRKFSTIGIDCVAMNVNDVVCVGAEPLAIVDYIALSDPNESLVAEIIKGLTEGAKQASVAIIGGETAIMPDVVDGKGKNAFDLAASCVGIVDENKLVLAKSMRKDDVIIGLHSSGIHSNGLTLARKVLLKQHGIREKLPNSSKSIGMMLLTPTKIYSPAIMQILNDGSKITGLAHITGGAFGKITRLTLGRNLGFDIENLPEPPEIFGLIQEEGRISKKEMYRTFNMGIGFCVISRKSDVSEIIRSFDSLGIESNKIGRVIARKGVYIDGERIA